MTEALRHRVALICAPSGYGVSSVLRDAVPTDGVYVSLRPGTTLARLASDLAEVLAPLAPGLSTTLAAAHERSQQAHDPSGALAVWFARQVHDLAVTVVVDNLQNAKDTLAIEFLCKSVDLAEGCRWVIASENLDELPVASWLAYGTASLPLTETDLALTWTEARTIAVERAPTMPLACVRRRFIATEGRVSDFVFLLKVKRAKHATLSVDATIESIVSALPRDEQRLLVKSVLLPHFAPDMIRAIAGAGAVEKKHAVVAFDSIRNRHPELFEEDGSRYQRRVLHFLSERLAGWTGSRRVVVVSRTARALEVDGDVFGALALFVGIRFQAGILRVIERHGFALIESKNAYIVHDAIAVLDEAARAGNFAVLAILAIAATQHGQLDVSESLFQHALAAAATSEQKIRVRYLYATDLLRRGRRDAIDLLRPDATFFEAPPPLRVLMMSALAVAKMRDGHSVGAFSWIRRALALSEKLYDRALSARVHHQAAWISLHAGDSEMGTRMGQRAADMAEQVGAYETASSAYSVLYEIAADLDDDPQRAAEYLRKVADTGGKCGNVEKQLFAWVGAYEIGVETGDAATALSVEREIREFDVQYSSHIIMEALAPAQVLPATWTGGFDRAYDTLASSADQQWTPDREALRWSEIAVYAAASRSRAKATAAVVAALEKLRAVPNESVRSLRARLFCALAFILLGRRAAPRMILDAVAREMRPEWPRLQALAVAIGEMATYRETGQNYDRLIASFEALHKCGFGGVAKMLAALPADVAGELERAAC